MVVGLACPSDTKALWRILQSFWQGFTSLTDPQRNKAMNKLKEGRKHERNKRGRKIEGRLEKKPESFGKEYDALKR
jgi:hypothetical protein